MTRWSMTARQVSSRLIISLSCSGLDGQLAISQAVTLGPGHADTQSDNAAVISCQSGQHRDCARRLADKSRACVGERFGGSIDRVNGGLVMSNMRRRRVDRTLYKSAPLPRWPSCFERQNCEQVLPCAHYNTAAVDCADYGHDAACARTKHRG